MALPTAAAIRALNLPNISGTGEDTYLGTQIVAADVAIADACCFPKATPAAARTMEATAYTWTLDGPDRTDPRILRTGMPPITTLTSIKQDTTGVWAYATTESSANYTLDPETGTDIYANVGSTLAWGTGLRYIQIVATAGYNVGAHAALTQAIGLLVSHWMAGRAPTPFLESQTMGGDAQTYARDAQLPPAVRALIAPYKLWARETHA